jgi:hypothetical protein
MFQPNWNSIMDRAIQFAFHKLKDTDKVSELVLAKHVKGQKADQGYRYIKEAGLSVQGQDANNAFKTTAKIFRDMSVNAEFVFAWYDNPKAVYGQVCVWPASERLRLRSMRSRRMFWGGGRAISLLRPLMTMTPSLQRHARPPCNPSSITSLASCDLRYANTWRPRRF